MTEKVVKFLSQLQKNKIVKNRLSGRFFVDYTIVKVSAIIFCILKKRPKGLIFYCGPRYVRLPNCLWEIFGGAWGSGKKDIDGK